MLRRIGCLSVAVFLYFVLPVVAAPIDYIYTGIGSGSIGGVDFPNRTFTITGRGDTDAIGGDSWAQEVNHISTTIEIDGMGTYTIISPLRTFLTSLGHVGLSRQNPPGGDLYNFSDDFTGWDLVTNWGPVSTSGNLSLWNWQYRDVETSGGLLVFNDASQVAGTFQAILQKEENVSGVTVPTMNEWGILLLTFFMLGAMVRQIKKIKN